MIRPTTRLILLLLLGLPLSLLPSILGQGSLGYWLSFLGVVFIATVWEALSCLRSTQLDIELSYPAVLYVGNVDHLKIQVQTRRSGQAKIEFRADLSAELHSPPHQFLEVSAEQQSLLMPLRPKRRGQVQLEKLWLRWTSPFGLLQRVHTLEQGPQIQVQPNIHHVRAAAIKFYNNELYSGLKVERQRGDGTEFDELRDFSRGHDPRNIDWSATAKHRKLLCRHFRTERNHQVIICFDTGRLMREPIDGLPKIDHAINAGLLLSYIALKTGDRVGLYSFDSTPGLFAKPQSGTGTFARLQQQVAELDYSSEETNFTLGITDLATRVQRRSLIVLVTDFIDTTTAELMLENLTRLAKRHLILFLSLRDSGIDDLTTARPETADDLNLSVLAEENRKEREKVLLKLKRAGVQCIDTVPSKVSSQLLNMYTTIRKRELVG